MSFFKRFFSCSSKETSDSPLSLVPSLCLNKKLKLPEDSNEFLARSMSRNIKMTPMTTHLTSNMQSTRKKGPPQTKKLQLLEMRTCKPDDFSWGFIIGVGNLQSLPSRLLPKECLQVKVGRRQQLSSLSAIRARSLDCLAVYWGQLGCEFSIEQILCCRQKLVLIFQQWQILSTVLTRIDQQLLPTLSELPLSHHSDKLQYRIIELQAYLVVEFTEDPSFQSKLKDSISRLVELSLSEQQYYKVVDPLTVAMYFDITINRNKQEKIYIQKLLHELKREEESAKRTSEPSEPIYAIEVESAVNNEMRNTISKESKVRSEDTEQQVIYFQKILRQKRKESMQVKRIEVDVDILNLDVTEEEENEENCQQLSRKGFNLASPKKTRSKSVDSIYESYDFYDDQIYEKYS